MATHSRRDFLKFSAGLAGATAATALLPESIRKALAIEPNTVTGTIQDVQHIVVFMQENRSFDHYLGHLSGVRGYNDRFPVTLPNGKPVVPAASGRHVERDRAVPLRHDQPGRQRAVHRRPAAYGRRRTARSTTVARTSGRCRSRT